MIIGLLIATAGYFIYEGRFTLKTEEAVVTETTQVQAFDASEEQVRKSSSSIAVLPFVNMTSDKEQEYFSYGISEEILKVMAQIPNLHVTPRSSAFGFKGEKLNLTAVAN